MNRATRLAAITLLRSNNTLLVHVHSAFHGIVHRDAANGLTDKEKAYVMKRVATIKKAQEEISALNNQMFRNYNGIKKAPGKDW